MSLISPKSMRPAHTAMSCRRNCFVVVLLRRKILAGNNFMDVKSPLRYYISYSGGAGGVGRCSSSINNNTKTGHARGIVHEMQSLILLLG
jgi:hypothetical protein